jgi:NAD(P)-dependent dehydrogenase (short-subunit alcohol dehydrogenase family)
MDLEKKVTLVTGGAAGIGRAVAERFAATGASVVIADVNEAGEQVAANLHGRFVRLDVTRDDDVRAAVAAARPLDVLVNNAGGAPGPSYYPEAPVEQWSRILDLNLRGVMLATQLALAAMRGRGGAIVNVSSMAGYGLFPHRAPEYAAAKAALMRLTGALAPLAERDRVRVNCVCPDYVDTPAMQRSLEKMSEEERAEVPNLVPAEEIAELVLELVRDDSLAGRVLIRPAREQPRLLSLEGT